MFTMVCWHMWSLLVVPFHTFSSKMVAKLAMEVQPMVFRYRFIKEKPVVYSDSNLCSTDIFLEYTFIMVKDLRPLLLNTISYHVMFDASLRLKSEAL